MEEDERFVIKGYVVIVVVEENGGAFLNKLDCHLIRSSK
jgi:hypothetical protein